MGASKIAVSDAQELELPNLKQGQGAHAARDDNNAAEAPAAAGEAAQDECLNAPDEECSVCLTATGTAGQDIVASLPQAPVSVQCRVMLNCRRSESD